MNGLEICVTYEEGLLPGKCLMPASITLTLTAGDFVRNPDRFDYSIYLGPGKPIHSKQKAQWKRERKGRRS